MESEQYWGNTEIRDEKTILDSRFIITFKSYAPYESSINKKGRIMGPFRLNKGNISAQNIKELLYKEIKTKLIKKYNLKI